MFSMCHFLRNMLNMLIMWLTGMYCRWNQKKNSSRNIRILQRKMFMLWNQAIEQVKVKWMHFGPDEATWEMAYYMWAMHPSLFVGWENVLIYVLVYVLMWCFGICTYVYGCKYFHEICYKTPISGMGVMSLWFSCCYVVMLVLFLAG